MFWEKNLIYYAQRGALSRWYSKIEGHQLDDTNRIFDLDHISPNSAIQRKKSINKALKNWYSSNGNLRAWPYGLNRSDHDNSPEEKLSPPDKSWWSNYLKSIGLDCKTTKEISKALLDLSFCKKNWLEIASDDIKNNIKDNSTAKKITYSILNRNIELCQEWYKQLEISALLPKNLGPSSVTSLFQNILNLRRWKQSKSEDKSKVRFTLSIHNEKISISFEFDNKENTLSDSNINFYVKQEDEQDSQLDEQASLTLISYDHKSVIDLFKDFLNQLKSIKNKETREMLKFAFLNSLKKEYRDRIKDGRA